MYKSYRCLYLNLIFALLAAATIRYEGASILSVAVLAVTTTIIIKESVNTGDEEEETQKRRTN